MQELTFVYDFIIENTLHAVGMLPFRIFLISKSLIEKRHLRRNTCAYKSPKLSEKEMYFLIAQNGLFSMSSYISLALVLERSEYRNDILIEIKLLNFQTLRRFAGVRV